MKKEIWEKEFDDLCEEKKIPYLAVVPLYRFIKRERKSGVLEGRTCKQSEIDHHVQEAREKIKTDLLEIADEAEIEDLRREVVRYFRDKDLLASR